MRDDTKNGFMGIEMITRGRKSFQEKFYLGIGTKDLLLKKGMGKSFLLIFRLFKKVKRYQCRNAVVRVGFLDRKPR